MLNIKDSLGGKRRRENPPEMVCHQRSLLLEWKMSSVTNIRHEMERLSGRRLHCRWTQQIPVLLYILTFALLGKKHQLQFYKKSICIWFFFPLTNPLILSLSLSLQWKKSVMKHFVKSAQTMVVFFKKINMLLKRFFAWGTSQNSTMFMKTLAFLGYLAFLPSITTSFTPNLIRWPPLWMRSALQAPGRQLAHGRPDPCRSGTQRHTWVMVTKWSQIRPLKDRQQGFQGGKVIRQVRF